MGIQEGDQIGMFEEGIIFWSSLLHHLVAGKSRFGEPETSTITGLSLRKTKEFFIEKQI